LQNDGALNFVHFFWTTLYFPLRAVVEKRSVLGVCMELQLREITESFLII